jgi:hypothetical protein
MTAMAAAGFTTPARAAIAPQVAHGDPAPAGSYPFSVRFTMTAIPRPDGSTYDSACSGALIAPAWVVAAGHCFHDADRNRVGGRPPYGRTTATIGRTDLAETGGHVLDVVDVKQDPETDLAIARLSASVIDIVPLLLNPAPPRAGDILRLAGWGAIDGDSGPSDHLQTGQVKVTSSDPSSVYVTGYAPARDTSACTWDSGAPYFRETPFGNVLVSVESDGPGCPHSDIETTSRVDTSLRWIVRNLH